MLSKPLPPLSPDIVEAAEAAFGKRNIYVYIGGAADRLFADIDLSNLYPQEGMPQELPYLLTLVTIFQFNEGLADRQAAEATRVRVDWKYALHLPLNHPGLYAFSLCDFRQRLFTYDCGKAQFERVLTRLQKTPYLPEGPFPNANADTVLKSVCTRSRLDWVISALQTAVQTLVTTQHEWLRWIVPPHWYQRYSRDLSTLEVPDDLASQIALAESIGEDGWYLLQAIAQADSEELGKLAEIQDLQEVWERHYQRKEGRCQWRPSECVSCQE